MEMPLPDLEIIARRRQIAADLRRLVSDDRWVISEADKLRPYECDGLMAYRQPPLIVVLPGSTAELASVMRYCHTEKIKVVPRGAGTSLSGGALGLADGITIGTGRLNRILDVDYANRTVTCQPGVTNLAITRAVEGRGFYYAPDPSSQIACTIGGNVAENSGGVHCLKYGLTVNNVLGIELVLPDGEILRLGGKHTDPDFFDLLGVITGSEGLLGIVTEIIVRILPRPATARALLAAFPSVPKAGDTVAAIIAAGIIPAGLEMMDQAALRAAEEYCHAGYPTDAAAILICELDGPAEEVDELILRVSALAAEHGADGIRLSNSEEERATFWLGRKSAFPAVGRISPDYLCMDGTIPRKRLTEVLEGIADLSERHGLRCCNVFHAGDGNLHPLILFDANLPGELDRAEAFGADILRLCVAVGGVLTGEHGVGVEKRDLMGVMFSEADLDHQQRLKCAFDAEGLLNPGKVYPTLHRCAELGKLHVRAGALPFPELPRF